MTMHQIVSFVALLGLAAVIVSTLASGETCPGWAEDAAGYILGGVVFDTAFCAELEVPSLHMHLLLLYGVYPEGDTLRAAVVGLNLDGCQEIVTVVELAPRWDSLSTEVRINVEEAIEHLENFFEPLQEFPPRDFYPRDSNLVVLDSLGPEKFWRTNELAHIVDGALVMPSVCIGEVDAMHGLITTIAFHEEVVTISTIPDIDADSARSLARDFLADSAGYDVADLLDGESELLIGYGNRIFAGQGWQWSDDQRLMWGCTFLEESGDELLQVWVNAHDPFGVEGGLIYESLHGDLFCIGDQQNDCQVWQQALERMGYEVDVHSVPLSVPDVQMRITTGDFFLMHTHGRLGPCGDGCPSALLTDFDSTAWFCPSHVPANALRWALMSCCHSANTCLEDDFRSTFVDRGSDVFQGYRGIVTPDLYERYQTYFLELGHTFANAHQLSKVCNPLGWQNAIYSWAEGAYNQVRLAPLQVRTYSNTNWWEPAVAGEDTLQVWVEVSNRDDYRKTPAESLMAEIRSLPKRFTLLTSPVQERESLAHGETWRVSWNLVSNPADSGAYPVDVSVHSTNLGVAIDDPGDSLSHRCWIYVRGNSDVADVDAPNVPDCFALSQNYPNPFNSTTVIPYYLPAQEIEGRGQLAVPVTLRVYNVAGQRVRTLVDSVQPPGTYRVIWNGRDDWGREVTSGIYLCRLQMGEYRATRRLVLLR